MIGFRHVMNSIGKLFTQLLSSLNLVEGVPVGMADEISGNDAVYIGAVCFQVQPSGSGNFNIATPIVLSGDYKIEFNWVKANTGVGGVYGGGASSSLKFYQANTTQVNIRFDGTGTNSLKEVPEITNQSGVVLKCIVERIGNQGKLTVNGNEYDFGTVVTGDLTIDFFGGLDGTSFILNGCMWDFKIHSGGSYIHRYPMSEYISLPTNHTTFDVIGDKDASLSNGNTNNRATQDVFFYNQLGFYNNGTQDVPIKEDGSEFADGTALTDPAAILQSGNDWLNDGTKIKQPEIIELINADVDNVYFDIGGNAKDVTFAEVEGAISNNPSVYGGNVVSGKKIKNISLK